MNIHNIIIFEFDSLYKILSEIKNNLPFKINNLKKLESKDSNFVESSLVITNYINKNFLLKERKIDTNKILFLTKTLEIYLILYLLDLICIHI